MSPAGVAPYGHEPLSPRIPRPGSPTPSMAGSVASLSEPVAVDQALRDNIVPGIPEGLLPQNPFDPDSNPTALDSMSYSDFVLKYLVPSPTIFSSIEAVIKLAMDTVASANYAKLFTFEALVPIKDKVFGLTSMLGKVRPAVLLDSSHYSDNGSAALSYIGNYGYVVYAVEYAIKNRKTNRLAKFLPTPKEKIPFKVLTPSVTTPQIRIFPTGVRVTYVPAIDPQFISKMGRTWDFAAAKYTLAHLPIRNEPDLQFLFTNRLHSHNTGDNHQLLLFRALCYYRDFKFARAFGGHIIPKVSVSNLVYSSTLDVSWFEAFKSSTAEPVNCLDMSADETNFWVACTSPRPCFTSEYVNGGVAYQTLYSRFTTITTVEMRVFGPYRPAQFANAREWVGNHDLVARYIGAYINKFGIEQQLEDLLPLLDAMPWMVESGTRFALPTPAHISDWFANAIVCDRPSDMWDSYTQVGPSTATLLSALISETLTSSFSDVVEVEAIARSVSEDMTLPARVIRHQTRLDPTATVALGVGLFAKLTGGLGRFLAVTSSAGGFASRVLALTSTPYYKGSLIGRYLSDAIGEGTLTSKLFHKPMVKFTQIAPGVLETDQDSRKLLEIMGVINPDGDAGDKLRSHRYSTNSKTPLQLVLGDYDMYKLFDEEWDDLILTVLKVSYYGITLEPKYDLAPRDYADVKQAIGSWYSAYNKESEAGFNVGGRRVVGTHPALATPAVETGEVGPPLCTPLQVKVTAPETATATEVGSTVEAQRENSLRRVLNSFSLTLPDREADTYRWQDLGGNSDCGFRVLVSQLAINGRTVSLRALHDAAKSALGYTPVTDWLDANQMVLFAGYYGFPMTVYSPSPSYCATKITTDGEPNALAPLVVGLRDGHWYSLVDQNCRANRGASIKVGVGAGMASEREVAEEMIAALARKPLLPGDVASTVPVSLLAQVAAGEINDGMVDKSISLFDSGRISATFCSKVLKLAYPKRAIPRFLGDLLLKSDAPCTPAPPKLTKSCLACALHVWEKATKAFTPNEVCSSCTSAATLPSWIGWRPKPHNSEEADRFDDLFPSRHPPTANKANVRPQDVYSAGYASGASSCAEHSKANPAGYLMARRHGQSRELVSSVALWAACANLSGPCWYALLEQGFLEWCECTWVDESKKVHDSVRKHGVIGRYVVRDDELSQVLYLTSLYGRGGVTIDWETELSKRLTPPDEILAYTQSGWTACEADRIIEESVRHTMGTAWNNIRPKKFDDFMDQAYHWLVSGSVAGFKSILKSDAARKAILKEFNLVARPTKSSVMESIPRSKVLSILTTRPKILSKAHMKLNETGGKARAIYGVSLWHYIYSNWLMADFEKGLVHDSVDINIANKTMVEQIGERVNWARDGAVVSSYDYPDFNSMHSYKHMALIYKLAKDVYLSRPGLSSEDQQLAATAWDWLVDSVELQIVFHPETAMPIRLGGTLFSGNRDTTLINTVLNIAYASVVDSSLSVGGYNPGLLVRKCHGDDIVATFETYEQAIRWNEWAEKANLKGQEGKILVERSYFEYLRVFGCRDGVLRGSLARCIASFTNGNWETEGAVSELLRLDEFVASLSTIARRKGKYAVINELLKHSLQRLARYEFADTNVGDEALMRYLLLGPDVGGSGIVALDGSQLATATSLKAKAVSQKVPAPGKGTSTGGHADRRRALLMRLEREGSSPLPTEVVTGAVAHIKTTLPPGVEITDMAGLVHTIRKGTIATELPPSTKEVAEAVADVLSVVSGARKEVIRTRSGDPVSFDRVMDTLAGVHTEAKLLKRYRAVTPLVRYMSFLGNRNDAVVTQAILAINEAEYRHLKLSIGFGKQTSDPWRDVPEVQALMNEYRSTRPRREVGEPPPRLHLSSGELASDVLQY